MPTLLYNNVNDADFVGMDDLYVAKKKYLNKVKSNRKQASNADTIKYMINSNYASTADPNIVNETVKGLKLLYNKNIDLMIKLKNKFSEDLSGGPATGLTPSLLLPPTKSTKTTKTTKTTIAPIPPFSGTKTTAVPPIAPALPPTAPAFVPSAPTGATVGAFMATPIIPPAGATYASMASAGLVPTIAPSTPTGFRSGLATMLGLPPTTFGGTPPSGAGLYRNSYGGYYGGVLRINPDNEAGTSIMTLIDQIKNNDSLIQEILVSLIPIVNYISYKNFNEILALNKKFFDYFSPDKVPYRGVHINYPYTPIGVDFNIISRNLEELYDDYDDNVIRDLIPKLVRAYSYTKNE